jgi:hypothetical protein
MKRNRLPLMNAEFDELIRKRVGGSLRNVPVLKRVAMLQANARFLRKQTLWTPPADDGTLVRKTVGRSC